MNSFPATPLPPELVLIPDSDPRLHTKTEVFNPRGVFDLKQTVGAMFTLMHANDGIGLAAPQVGLPYRMFIMSIRGLDYVCINPTVKKRDSVCEIKEEGCLSYPGQHVLVERPKEIRVSYLNLSFQRTEKTLRGLAARCFLHELDHLDGIVMQDRAVV